MNNPRFCPEISIPGITVKSGAILSIVVKTKAGLS